MQGVTHATLAALSQRYERSLQKLALHLLGGGEIILVCACPPCQTGVAWCEIDMRRGCEAGSVCGASAPLGGRGGGIEAAAEKSVGGVEACDYSAALMELPRLCLSETNSDHVTE